MRVEFRKQSEVIKEGQLVINSSGSKGKRKGLKIQCRCPECEDADPRTMVEFEGHCGSQRNNPAKNLFVEVSGNCKSIEDLKRTSVQEKKPKKSESHEAGCDHCGSPSHSSADCPDVI